MVVDIIVSDYYCPSYYSDILYSKEVYKEMSDWVIIFFVTVFSLMTWSSEAERDTTIAIEYSDEFMTFTPERMVEIKPDSITTFEDEMKLLDSLWLVIKIIELLENDYFILDKREWELRTIEMLQYGKEGYFKK